MKSAYDVPPIPSLSSSCQGYKNENYIRENNKANLEKENPKVNKKVAMKTLTVGASKPPNSIIPAISEKQVA